MTEDLVTNLEIKILHLENSLDELNKEVYSQSKKMDELQLALKKISDLIKLNPPANPDIGPADEKPPHY